MDGIRIESNCGTRSWCLRIAGLGETGSVRSEVFYMSNKGKDTQEADRTGVALFLFVYLFVSLFVLHIKGTRF